MSTIEELKDERDRLYQEHNEAFQAWMDAEVELTNAIAEEAAIQRHTQQARKYAFLTVLGFIGAAVLAHWSIA